MKGRRQSAYLIQALDKSQLIISPMRRKVRVKIYVRIGQNITGWAAPELDSKMESRALRVY